MLSFVRKYRTAIRELVNEKRYIEALFAVGAFPMLYGFNILLGEVDPDNKEEVIKFDPKNPEHAAWLRKATEMAIEEMDRTGKKEIRLCDILPFPEQH